MRRRQALGAAACVALLPASMRAQARPIRLVVPYPPGGPLDIVARALAERVKDSLGVVFIDNKPGAGGNLGSAEVARAAPDGYTWLFGPDTLITVNPHVYKQMPFRVDDLVPVTIGT